MPINVLPYASSLCRFLAVATLVLATAESLVGQDDTDFDRPNIVHIFADDMGWGTGQFNNPSSEVRTPSLNELAENGINFTRGYAATVCSPSRAMLMTGLHPGHGFNDRNGNIGQGIRDEDVTVAETLQQGGYSTGVFGKWGWGGTGGSGELRPNPAVSNVATLPHNQGFDKFYGYLNHGRAHSYQVDSLWTNIEPADDDSDGVDEVGEKYQAHSDGGLWLEKTGNNPADTHANYTHDLIGLKSEAFIRDHAGDTEPFYMQVNYTIPHFDLDEIVNVRPLMNLRGDVIAPAGLSGYASMANLSDKEKKHAAMISRMDASIGSLINRLDDPDGDGDNSDSILANTLIIFSSDNGPTPEDGLGNSGLQNLELAGGLRGGKRDQFEGGIRTPMLVRWDGAIDENRRGTTDQTPTDLADFFATAAEVAGLERPLGIDGVSIAPQITGSVDSRTRLRPYLVTENFENSNTGEVKQDWAVIRGNQKLIRFNDGSYALFDLASDPTETSPLDLQLPANAALKNELESVALADGAGQADNYYARHRSWQGGQGDRLEVAENWNESNGDISSWIATVENNATTPRVAVVSQSVEFLGLEVRGSSAEQIVDIQPGQTLSGRNEVRIRTGGRVEVAGATLESNRWIEVEAGGRLGGDGAVKGNVYNLGRLAPGRAGDLPDLAEPPAPKPMAPADLDTGLVTLVDFDFTGVQDDAPLTQVSTINENVELVEGFNFGPATAPRHPQGGGTNAGNEFNVQDFSTGTTLESALSGGNYLTVRIAPDGGAGIILDSVRFDMWRNGVNAADHYAIFSSIHGFSDEQVLAQFAFDENSHGVGNTQTLTATLSHSMPVTDTVEVRIYGWGSNNSAGNTHFNVAAITGSIVAVPTLAFDFTGVQDHAPLTDLSIGTPQLQVASGLDFGPGLRPMSDVAGTSTNAGDEFNVTDWSEGGALAGAIDGGDYLGFSVVPVDGLAVMMDSVSFNLWRDSENAPVHYAILSSIDGFSEAAALVTESIHDFAMPNQHRLIGQFVEAEPTQDEIEFRLYGWGAEAGGNTHVSGVSLRAQFQTVDDRSFDPAGAILIDGDLFHLAGGSIELEIGGIDDSDSDNPQYDQLTVTGNVELEGDLHLALIDGFVPAQGDIFDLLHASSINGRFDQVTTDDLGLLRFQLVYESTRVRAVVTPLLPGDFNVDGIVNAADYLVWRNKLGAGVTAFTGPDANGSGTVDTGDYEIWQANFGATAPANAVHVPEPSPLFMLVASGLLAVRQWARCSE